jgi:hypothetical protein
LLLIKKRIDDMRKIIMVALSLVFFTGCASIQDTITSTIQNTIQDTINNAEQTAKDKLGDILGNTVTGGTVNASLNNPFRLRMSQTGVISSEGLNIKFTSITEDSRCPVDVQCVQVGQVTAQINVTQNSSTLGDYTLTLRPSSNLHIQRIGNYTFTLNSVEPASFSSSKRPGSSDYYITLTVTR